MTELDKYINKVKKYTVTDEVILALLGIDSNYPSRLLWSPFTKTGLYYIHRKLGVEREILNGYDRPVIVIQNDDVVRIYELPLNI